MQDLYKQLKNFGKTKANASLAKYTTFKIGGPARFLVEVENTENLVDLLKFLQAEGVCYYLLGGGSNILFSDDGFDGVVIKNNNKKLEINNNIITASAGVLLSQVLNLAAQNSLTGLEWSAGVPGTVGGAVRGNAGAMGKDTSLSIENVKIFRDGEILDLENNECEFKYRESLFKNNCDIILEAVFKLILGGKTEILKIIQENIFYRKSRFPAFPSGGSFFKNLPLSAWTGDMSDLPEKFVKVNKLGVAWLIDQAGMKGFSVGGAKIADEHANFIINYNNATQKDILEVVEQVKQAVYNKFGIELEEEVQII